MFIVLLQPGGSDVSIFRCQTLPVFDAAILNHFCFLFSDFCLLFLRRQKPVVGDDAKTPGIMASEIGS